MNRLKELRLSHGYKSQKELADFLYVNQTAVSQWERGVTMPSSPMLLKLSELYGVSIDYLLGRTDEKKPTPKEGGGPALNKSLVDRLVQLSPEEQEKVEAFVQGMIAGRDTNGTR